ncbi:7673_t:CDS:2 [Entrophospora sp. SA101]|nr:7673_t:CDS:2 [Entrophospora sp. SA101]CAJ0840879.1 2847_t:CDS:2 [Entrophospora sp. SA101]CAJ0866356.1 18749_t:CDS:2 [Entrophospora sp. SA101]
MPANHMVLEHPTCLHSELNHFPNCAELADKAEALQVTLNSLFSDNLKEEDARQA